MAKKSEKTTDIAALSNAAFGVQPTTTTVTPAETATLFERKVSSTSSGDYTLQFGVVTIGIKTYKATDNDKVEFTTIHKTCGSKLSAARHMHCDKCDEDVKGMAMAPGADMAKGYEVAKGQYIAISKEELDGCKPASEGKMIVDEFVKFETIDPIYFESTMYIGADLKEDKTSGNKLGLLIAALKETGKAAVASMVTRGRQSRVVIRPYVTAEGQDGLVMHTLYFGYEVRDFDGWNKVNTNVNPEQLKAAVALINALSDDFDPDAMYDAYLVNTRKMLAAKVASAPLPTFEVEEITVQTDDIMEAIKASLANLGKQKEKVAARKTAAKKAIAKRAGK